MTNRSETPRTEAYFQSLLEGADGEPGVWQSIARLMFAYAKDLEEELTAAQALAEQYKRDAERYRWLRPRLHSADWSYGDPPASVITFQWPEMPVGVGDALDAAIDAAKSEQEK